MSEREKAEMMESFRENLDLLKQLRIHGLELRKELASGTPNPFKVADYGRTYSIQLEEKYRAYVSEIEGKIPPRVFDDLISASYETRYPQFVMELAESDEAVAGTSMKEVVRSLLEDTDFRTAILEETAGLKGLDTRALQEAEGTDAILAELRRLAPELNQKYAEKAAKLLPSDPRYPAFLDDHFRSQVVQNVVNTYKSVRMVEIEKVEREATKLAADLNSQLRRLPNLSDERVRLAGDFSAAIRATDAR